MTRTAFLPLLACLSFTPVTGCCFMVDCMAPGVYITFLDSTGQPVEMYDVELVLDGVNIDLPYCEFGCSHVEHHWNDHVEDGAELELHYTSGMERMNETYTLEFERSTCCDGVYVNEYITVE